MAYSDVFGTQKGRFKKKPISGLVPGCLYLDLYLFASKKEVLRPKRGLAFKLMPQSEAFYLDPTPAIFQEKLFENYNKINEQKVQEIATGLELDMVQFD